MNIKKEIEKIKEKNLNLDEFEELKNDDIEKIEYSLKTEIRKNSLVLQNKIDSLINEITNLNTENEELKKQIFRMKRKEEKNNELVFNIEDIYLSLTSLIRNSNDLEILNLMRKKVKNLLKDIEMEATAEIGMEFNYKYHEIVNDNIEKKENYLIKEIISQGYIKEGKIIKIAKVLVN